MSALGKWLATLWGVLLLVLMVSPESALLPRWLSRYQVVVIFQRTGYEACVLSRHLTWSGAIRTAERRVPNQYFCYEVRPTR